MTQLPIIWPASRTTAPADHEPRDKRHAQRSHVFPSGLTNLCISRLGGIRQWARTSGGTQQHLESAVAKLRQALAPLDIEPVLEVREIDDKSFRDETSESNRVWIAGKPLEQWLDASVGSSRCCSVCGGSPCRTVEVEDVVHEEIPENVILKAGMIAASTLLERCTAGHSHLPLTQINDTSDSLASAHAGRRRYSRAIAA